MGRHANLFAHALDNLVRSAGVYALAAGGLTLGLTLLLSGVAIGEGLKAQARGAVASGADVLCTWDRFGRDAPIPAEALAELAALPGVERAVPRIIGRLSLGPEVVMAVGLPLLEVGRFAVDVEGHAPQEPGEILIGRELARAVGLRPGAVVALSAATDRLYTVSGVASGGASLWGAKALVGDLKEMQILFDDPAHVSDLSLFVRPGYASAIADAARRLQPRLRVQTKALMLSYVGLGITLREGAFSLLLLMVIALAVPAFAAFTFLGFTPRRKEIALLKAEGWQTADVLEMIAFEDLVISALVATSSMALAVVWTRWLRAPLIAPFFIPDMPAFPAVDIPTRFTPLPLGMALALSLVVTFSGSIYAAWRTASVPPARNLQ